MQSGLKYRLFNICFLVFPTILIFAFSLWLTILWRYPEGLNPNALALHVRLFGSIGVVWLALYYGFGLLDVQALRRFDQIFAALVGANSMSVLVAIVFFYFQPTLIITPRRFLFVDILFVFVFTTIWQFLIRSVTKRIARQTSYLVHLEQEYLACRQELSQQDTFDVHPIEVTELAALAKKTHRTYTPLLFVVPTAPVFSKGTLELFAHLHAHGATFIRFNDFYEDLFRRVYTTNLNDWWLLEHIHHDPIGLYPIVKRLFDLLFALLIAIVFLITFPFVALLIKLSDGGKIFFTQTRLSVNGTPFTIYKYRTMRAGTPNNTWTEDHDPRVTAVGRFLRITRLDELPQWINILHGDMSLIGPRPEQAGIVEQLKEEIPYFESRHAIRPGLIGWAQLHVYAGNAAESKRKLQYDLYYLKHRSFLFDMEILLKTIAHVFFLNGK